MTTSAMPKTQKALEARATELLKEFTCPPEKTLNEWFGPPPEWIIEIGNFRLLLIPFLQEWFWYDQVHEDWIFTGYQAGETTFRDVDGNLVPPPENPITVMRRSHKKVKPGPPAPAGSAGAGLQRPAKVDALMRVLTIRLGLCPACDAPLNYGKRFCGSCGAAITLPVLEKSPAFCPACGHPRNPEKKYCGSCGRKY